MHLHLLEDDNGELVDYIKFCSDACHQFWCRENDSEYLGWSGCHEAEHTDWCEQCGVVLPGLNACECQLSNVTVNRFPVSEPEICECGNIIQVSTPEDTETEG